LPTVQLAVGKDFYKKNQKTRKSLPTTTLGSRQIIFIPKKNKKEKPLPTAT
jgi:hypothetical protein